MSSEEHPIEPTQPPDVIPPRRAPRSNNVGSFAEILQSAIDSISHNAGLNLRAMVIRDLSYDELSPEDQKLVDALMEKVAPEIEEKAKVLLAAEIKDRIVRHGDFVSLGKMLKKGKKLSIKRKKGCIFIQFGTGDAEDPIEEFLVAST